MKFHILISDMKEIFKCLKWLDRVVKKGFIEEIAFRQHSAVNIVKSQLQFCLFCDG